MAKFRHPTHQVSFHTPAALAVLKFVKGEEVKDEGLEFIGRE